MVRVLIISILTFLFYGCCAKQQQIQYLSVNPLDNVTIAQLPQYKQVTFTKHAPYCLDKDNMSALQYNILQSNLYIQYLLDVIEAAKGVK